MNLLSDVVSLAVCVEFSHSNQRLVRVLVRRAQHGPFEVVCHIMIVVIEVHPR